MARVNITGTITTPSGDGIEGVYVIAVISGAGPPYTVDDYIIPYEQARTKTTAGGGFTLSLWPNADLSPAGSSYNFRIEKGLSSDAVFYSNDYQIRTTVFEDIVVPGTESSYSLTDLI